MNASHGSGVGRPGRPEVVFVYRPPASHGNVRRSATPRSRRMGDEELWSPCFQMDVVGTAGAGDATIGGSLSALLRGLPTERALMAAVDMGACNAKAADDLSGICSWDDTMRRVESGWARRSLSLKIPD